MIDDWRYVSLVMDRFLMYIYMIVTVVATCYILIQRSAFISFDQEAFRYSVNIVVNTIVCIHLQGREKGRGLEGGLRPPSGEFSTSQTPPKTNLSLVSNLAPAP